MSAAITFARQRRHRQIVGVLHCRLRNYTGLANAGRGSNVRTNIVPSPTQNSFLGSQEALRPARPPPSTAGSSNAASIRGDWRR